MKHHSIVLFTAFAAAALAEESHPSFTPSELAGLALSANPELSFYEQQVAALPNPSGAKPPVVPQPLDFPSREKFRRALLNLDAGLARLYLDEFRFALGGEVRLKAMEYEATTESAATAGDLAARISALVQMLEERPAAGVEALIERRILEGAALPFVRLAAEADMRSQLLRTEINGLLGRGADEPLAVTGSFESLPEPVAGTMNGDTVPLMIREAEIARGLAGTGAANDIESFAIGGWFTRGGLGAAEAVAGVTRPGSTAGSTIGETMARLIDDARAKLARETARRRTSAEAAREVASSISPKLVDNLRAASDLAERQYRVGALGVNILTEAHREYLGALQARNDAVIQAWRNSLDLELLNLPATGTASGKSPSIRNHELPVKEAHSHPDVRPGNL